MPGSARYFVMLDGLRGRGKRRVPNLVVRRFTGNLLGFFKDAVDRRTIDRLLLGVVHFEDLFQPHDMTFGLAQVARQALLQARICRLVDHCRQVLHDLLLGVEHVLQLMDEKFVQVFDVFGEKAHDLSSQMTGAKPST